MIGIRGFKFEIDTRFKDNKRNITIINREYRIDKRGIRRKWYQYNCNKCGYSEGWIEESHLNNGEGCPCCSTPIKKVLLGINTIYDTDNYLIAEYGLNKEFAQTHSIGTTKKGRFVCKDCGCVKYAIPHNVKHNKSIGCSCGDNFSYPEKFMFNVLKQINIDFITQLSESTFKWCNKYKYDFYIPSTNTIIETHGEQHYKGSTRGRCLKEEQENDTLKESLAKENGIKNYIVIDCRISDMDFIKENILKSKLKTLFDLSIINWDLADEYAWKTNLRKEVCDYWNNKKDYETTKDLAKIFNLNRSTITLYLKKGHDLKWCEYNPQKERIKNLNKCGKNSKKIEVFKNGKSLGLFKSVSEVCYKGVDDWGIKFSKGNISEVCNGRRNNHKGFTFKYISN